MAVLIDTDLLIDRERGARAHTLDELLGSARRAISVITVSELLHGVHRQRGAVRAQRRARVEHILAGLRPIPVTVPIARLHAEVGAQLASRGVTVGANDLWIAATALGHGLALATRNVADFERVPGLHVLAPEP